MALLFSCVKKGNAVDPICSQYITPLERIHNDRYRTYPLHSYQNIGLLIVCRSLVIEQNAYEMEHISHRVKRSYDAGGGTLINVPFHTAYGRDPMDRT